MNTLIQMLNHTEEAILTTIAQTWDIIIADHPTNKAALIELIEATMLDADNAERAWDALPDDQRQALQTLLGAGGEMQMSMFTKMFGDIRKMGRKVIEHEQPHQKPASPAEALYYKGFLSKMLRRAASGPQAVAYVPEDLILVLPTHKTSYDNLDADDPTGDTLPAVDPRQLDDTRPADTSVVDDMTALLAFLQLHGPPIDGGNLADGSLRALMPYLLTHGTARIAFMLAVGVDADLITVHEGRAYPDRSGVRDWLAAPRSKQLEQLIRAWLDSENFGELYHISELTVENAPHYDPRIARRVIQKGLKESVPPAEWWGIDEFVYTIKQALPDFQRPNGNYDSWYILDMGGAYLRGFESWDAVEGLQLEGIIRGPLHWLGLVDIAPEAARLTAYGRGVVGMGAFPHPADDPEPITIHPDGRLQVSRKVARKDRFQLARFTTWEQAPPLGSEAAFTYKLDRAGVAQADAQDITAEHIRSFLKRMLGDAPIPEPIDRMLANWRSGDTSIVTLAHMVVLQTTSAQVLDELAEMPEVRRYLGRRLGDLAIAVRAEQWEALQQTLAEMGFDVVGR